MAFIVVVLNKFHPTTKGTSHPTVPLKPTGTHDCQSHWSWDDMRLADAWKKELRSETDKYEEELPGPGLMVADGWRMVIFMSDLAGFVSAF